MIVLKSNMKFHLRQIPPLKGTSAQLCTIKFCHLKFRKYCISIYVLHFQQIPLHYNWLHNTVSGFLRPKITFALYSSWKIWTGEKNFVSNHHPYSMKVGTHDDCIWKKGCGRRRLMLKLHNVSLGSYFSNLILFWERLF